MRDFLIRLANAENIEEYYTSHREEFISLAENINDENVTSEEIQDLMSQISLEIEQNEELRERLSIDMLSALVKAKKSEIVEDILMQLAEEILPEADDRKERITKTITENYKDSDDETKARTLDYLCGYVVSNIESDKQKSDLIEEMKLLKTGKMVSDDSLYSLLSEY
jgi:ferritin